MADQRIYNALITCFKLLKSSFQCVQIWSEENVVWFLFIYLLVQLHVMHSNLHCLWYWHQHYSQWVNSQYSRFLNIQIFKWIILFLKSGISIYKSPFEAAKNKAVKFELVRKFGSAPLFISKSTTGRWSDKKRFFCFS